MSDGAAADVHVFTGSLRAFQGLLVQQPRSDSMPVSELADVGRLHHLLAHHHARSGADWRAACSYWSQVYFRSLIVPAVGIVLLGREPIGLKLADLRVVLCPERSLPVQFVFGSAPPPPTVSEPLASLLDEHLAPLIAALSQVGQLSRKLLWENAAWPLAFVLREAIERRPMLAGTVAALIDRPVIDAASRGALASVRRTALGEMPFERRLCCMRDRIPALSRCAGQCPRRPREEEGL